MIGYRPIAFALFIAGISMTTMPSPTDAIQSVSPPTAAKVPKVLESHGVKRIDPYYWLNERENPKVIEYLNQENRYTDAKLEPVKKLEEKLFQEIKGRIKEDDSSVPYFSNGYWYYRRFEKSKQYPIHCRKKESMEAAEEILLDVNEVASGHSYCSVVGLSVSPDNSKLAYGVDLVGRRKYTLQFNDLKTGKVLEESLKNVTGSGVWAKDNRTVFFTRKDPQTLRACRVFRHKLGTDPEKAPLVFEEKDEEFFCYVTESRSKDFIIIGSNQTLSNEYRVLPADQPDGEFQVFFPRKANHEYSIDHLGDKFYILSNWKAENFQLFTCDKPGMEMENWKLVIPHRKDTLLEDFDLFQNFVVLSERREAAVHLRVFDSEMKNDYYLPFDDPAYVAETAVTPEPNTNLLRFTYTSLTTPYTVYEFDLKTQKRTQLKQTEVVGSFDSKNYRSQRIWAKARDGVKVPVSIVYHKDTQLDGSAPCLEYAYGSYGSSSDPYFSSANLSLLDRGFVYAIAHIRGGQEMGRRWYENGKLLKKKNTFFDFIDVGKHLVEEKICDPKRLYARGGSAGGLLMGAIINYEPQLYHGVVADVPFVDVVTTMLDDSIPLTTFEYDEWGNPNNKTYFDYMLSYSPYDQVEKKAYPNMLVTTGLHDSQVQYWEPAKWVAKLRDLKTDNNLLLLKTNMDAGHGGASGRFDRLKEVATRFAFLLMLAKQDTETKD